MDAFISVSVVCWGGCNVNTGHCRLGGGGHVIGIGSVGSTLGRRVGVSKGIVTIISKVLPWSVSPSGDRDIYLTIKFSVLRLLFFSEVNIFVFHLFSFFFCNALVYKEGTHTHATCPVEVTPPITSHHYPLILPILGAVHHIKTHHRNCQASSQH